MQWINCLEAWEPSALGKSNSRPVFTLDCHEVLVKETGRPTTMETPVQIVLASARLAIISKDGVPVCMLRIHQREFVATYLDVGPGVAPAVHSMLGPYGNSSVACFVVDGVAHFWAVSDRRMDAMPTALHWSLATSPDTDLDLKATTHAVKYDDRPKWWHAHSPLIQVAMLLDTSGSGTLTLECVKFGSWGVREFGGIMQLH